MKHFKKKTIALILASVITVVGAFGADNYKNSLMSLKFDSTENGDTNITVLTKTNYDAEISPIRKDANTYIIMLPETNSEMQESPTVSGNIQSVNVVTMPYTQSSNGYTKITVKTLSTGLLTAKKAVFLPTHNVPPIPKLPDNTNQPETYDKPTQNLQVNQNPSDTNYQNNENSIENSMRQFQGNNQNVQTNPQINKNKINKTETTEQTTNNNNTSKKSEVDPMERTLLILGSLAVLLGSIFFYMRGRNKLKEVIGEDFEYSLEDDTKQKQQNSQKDLRTTIQNLDKTYNKPNISTISRTAPSVQVKPVENFSSKNDTVSEDVIVDLDQLYIDANNGQNETVESNQNIDLLADFLNDYESQEKEKQHELELIEQREQETNELYEKFMSGEDILFSKDDIQKINDLLMAEISDETIENIKRKEVTNPIRPPHATEEDILENFITNLTIKQNISFSRDDVEALRKLISVEIDNNFVTDLRTNPERVKSMQKEIEDRRISPHRVSELLTLNVNDKLPNLTEAIKEQGNKEIESNAQPEVVYYSEGYDVKTLTIEDELPDLSKELNNSMDISEVIESTNDKDATDEFLEIDSLPDLKEVIANPEKYKEPEPEKVVADEETLLKNIENVSFKPFYEETQETEIIKTPENILKSPQAPSKEDIELNKIFEENVSPVTTTSSIENIKEEEEVPTYTYNNKEYTILKTSVLKDDAECHLVKSSDGYSVLGYLGENIFNLKEYNELSPETLQTRLSERLPEGRERYMVRCGKHKFVLDIKENKMEFVMDLC